jgi:dipeptidyl aminopeptidase/acylaminoacyl peptidase
MISGQATTPWRRIRMPAAWLLVGWLAMVPATAADRDGEIVATAPCAARPEQSYAEYLKQTKRRGKGDVQAAIEEDFKAKAPPRVYLLSKDEFAERTAFAGFECLQIRYLSDGMEIMGYIWKPQDTAGKKFPLIVYNHGGSGGPGHLNPWPGFGFHNFLKAGFVVIGSSYRGGSKGRDEYGGADVHDVMTLEPLAASLGYIDMTNQFMLGRSRGGMMTYLAMKQGFPLNAAATEAGNPNLVEESQRRPLLAAGLAFSVPGFDEHREERLRDRSAEFWPERITAPLLILHGSYDWRVQASTQERFAKVLEAAGKPHELHIYEADNHGLTMNRGDVDARVIAWFKNHMKPAQVPAQ